MLSTECPLPGASHTADRYADRSTSVLPRRYTGVAYDQRDMRVQLGDILLMDRGQPLDFDAIAASKYLKETTAVHGTVRSCMTLDALPAHSTSRCALLLPGG